MSQVIKITNFDIGIRNFSYVVYHAPKNIKPTNLGEVVDCKAYDVFSKQDNTITFRCTGILGSGKKKGSFCNAICPYNTEKCNKHTKEKPSDDIVKKPSNDKIPKNLYKFREVFCRNLIEILDAQNFCNVDVIVIETQLSKNKKCMMISHYLYMYLVQRCVRENVSPKIVYLTARGRMEGMCQYFKFLNIPFKDNNVKKYRKDNAVTLSLGLLEKKYIKCDEKLHKKILTTTKKDDICDNIIQALWWLYKSNKLKNASNNTI